MHQLEFKRIYDYSGDEESVVVPVTLRSGGNQVRLAASIDTGASFCIFRPETAEALGLTLERGVRLRFQTANSGFEAFRNDVEISVLRVTMNAMVYFFSV
jgi:predicted aspartyl protease